MEATHRLIVHGLMKVGGKYLILKRTAIKRGKPNSFPNYWDIPGGMVEAGELPTDAVIRETKEESNLDVVIKKIIHEDSNLDISKNMVFTRLVYLCEVMDENISNIQLQADEHEQYRLIDSLSEMAGEKLVDYVKEVLGKAD
ncbi:MAG: NUDIX hydrolase [Oscillospiraceae bacterium]|nr:NUDIX hydrolase [Oscillospiraceae bacterium]